MKNIIAALLLIASFSTFAFQDNKNEAFNTVSKKYYYKDGILCKQKWYNDDKKLDSLKTYYKSGELNEVFYYENSYYNGLSYQFNKSGKKLTTWLFSKGKLVKRTNHLMLFNSKTEEKVKAAYSKLSNLNKEIKLKPNSIKLKYQRASIRKYLGNNTLALNDFKKLKKKILKASKTKKVPKK